MSYNRTGSWSVGHIYYPAIADTAAHMSGA